MNISGSDVSKEAANMILLGERPLLEGSTSEIYQSSLDDNFASTVSECAFLVITCRTRANNYYRGRR